MKAITIAGVRPVGPNVSDRLRPEKLGKCATQAGIIAINPLQSSGWDTLIASLPGFSFFHGAAWARVLQQTYGHSPIYFCRFASGQTAELLPIMEVSNLLTGLKGVSLPFTDFCAPLVGAGQATSSLYSSAVKHGCQNGWRSLECRGSSDKWPGASRSIAYWGHVIELASESEVMLKKFKSAVRRGIRKAERAGVRVEFSNSMDSMRTFYSLHCLTRKRHGMPCQPLRFFANIVRFILAENQGFIATARLQNRPVAAAVFFRQGGTAIYKFGASDYAFQRLRPNNLVMWEGIKKCASSGVARLHLGRTSLSHEGLRRFKLGFGAREERIEYSKYDFRKKAFITTVDRVEGRASSILGHLPISLLRLTGALLYRGLS